MPYFKPFINAEWKTDILLYLFLCLSFCVWLLVNSFDEMYLFLLLPWSILSSTIHCYQSQIDIVEMCPTSKIHWEKRVKKTNCDAGSEYHCMMMVNRSLAEFCMSTRLISQGKISSLIELEQSWKFNLQMY